MSCNLVIIDRWNQSRRRVGTEVSQIHKRSDLKTDQAYKEKRYKSNTISERQFFGDRQ